MNDSSRATITPGRFVASHSVLTLDARHPYVAKSLVDAQDMHRTVMSGFQGWGVAEGSRDARAQMGVLSTWTLDLKEAALVLVVQSRVPADWGHVPRAALRDEPYLITVDRTFRVGDAVVFRTVVNPTYNKPQDGPDGRMVRGKRVAHTKPDGVRKWLRRHFGDGREPGRVGVTTDPDDVAVHMLPPVSSPSPHKRLRIARAELRGSLTVTNPGAFVTALSDGIGHARAYSCGLLLTR
ncbi:type I-E CRISPR-associated protein Cas6/Cse3/CasE [Streptomyces spectabilis]|uniref:CRISPR system Cascade subunit CasE n=1 Tax=Streptomyces spectabilis TaxID=68270 RepID=A0A7W8AU26_STRST|nr:type I-E CRISPR-associated protein Cas6/Cse3/CasE [Streptomyces spectabilis]MBB5103238.1 CRISPR system Cascade subunit CasE [Streptomyces spectabilis]MCI3902430.1 type I-E CRISPR-associated protein Cas6/Cse3/CasE [Streptomyces spectabilis]GGV13922.1 type I-E CRISPR-associated protein Cas6/Cse3/CasE [Streptomyces spectabilis]